jgi:hypothetical protein
VCRTEARKSRRLWPAPARRTGLVLGKLEADTMLSWQVGAVKITCVVEMLIPFPYDPEGSFLTSPLMAPLMRNVAPPQGGHRL